MNNEIAPSDINNFDENLGVIKLSGKVPELSSTEYGIFFVDSEPESFQQRSGENKEALKNLLKGNIDFESFQEKQALSLDVHYPEDSYGTIPENEQETNGIIRQEEIVTFISKNPENGELVYLARSRPKMPGTNTPGQLDPGVISHGGLRQAGVVNACTFAEPVQKNTRRIDSRNAGYKRKNK